eukprot:EG_transcript_19243
MPALDDEKWITLGSIPYRNSKCYDMCWESSNASFHESIVCVAEDGGLLAITRDPRKIVQLDSERNSIIFIYTASGVLANRFEWKGPSIVSMGWTATEQLVVVSLDGGVDVLNLQGFKVKTAIINDGRDKILEAKVFGTGLVALTKKLELWYIQDFNGEVLAHRMPSAAFDHPPLGFEVIPPERTKHGTVEVYVSPWSMDEEFGGTILVVMPDRVEDQVLSTSPITRIAISPDGKWIAKFNQKGHIVVSQVSFHQVICDLDTQSAAPPVQLCWCGTDAVVGQWGPAETGQDATLVLMVGPAGQHESFTYSGTAHLVTERDGLRILTSTRHDFLQR